jgi:hypothetical protein
MHDLYDSMTGVRHLSVQMRKTMLVGLASCVVAAHSVFAQTTYYVATNGGHVSPYATWANAATNIHDAVALAGAGATVWVTNGSYRLTNTITIATNFAICSVNGPDATILYRDSSAGSFRMVSMGHSNAVVSGFTLTNGSLNGSGTAFYLSAGTVSNCVITKCTTGSGYGYAPVCLNGGLVTSCVMSNNTGGDGGAAVSGGIMQDCIIVTNAGSNVGALQVAGGVARRCRIMRNSLTSVQAVYLVGGRVENCLIYGNAGGGVFMGGGSPCLVNCTVAGNSASSLNGGVQQTGGVITNCIIYGNIGKPYANYGSSGGSAWYSCAPEMTNAAQGNISINPQFMNAANLDFRLMTGSPCVDSGTNIAGVVNDLDHETRPLAGSSSGSLRHDMGCYEKNGASGPLSVGFAAAPAAGFGSVQAVFTAGVAGTNTTITWWGWDTNNDGVLDYTGNGLAVMTNTYGPGLHSVSLAVSNNSGETAAVTNPNCIVVTSTNIYVATNGAGIVPYSTWQNAATNIHDALAVALAGCAIWVSNGSYRLSNTVVLSSPITICGVNGPVATTLWRDASYGAFPLFVISDPGALVAGLTVTNGATLGLAGSAFVVYGGTVSNCVIARCTILSVYGNAPVWLNGGLVTSCVISNNTGGDGGASVNGSGILQDCTIVTNAGGNVGALQVTAGVVRRCRIMGNTLASPQAVYFLGGRIENSLIYGNPGGAVFMNAGNLVNCTVAGNVSVANVGGVQRNGGAITNCIIYGNTGSPSNDYSGDASAVWYSCAPGLTAGVQGIITSDPLFANAVNKDYRLRSGSPCIDKGITLAGMTTQTDLDGNRRVVGGKVDMGAYEAKSLGTAFMIR